MDLKQPRINGLQQMYDRMLQEHTISQTEHERLMENLEIFMGVQ